MGEGGSELGATIQDEFMGKTKAFPDLGERPMLCTAEMIPDFVFVCFIAVVIVTVRYISSM